MLALIKSPQESLSAVLRPALPRPAFCLPCVCLALPVFGLRLTYELRIVRINLPLSGPAAWRSLDILSTPLPNGSLKAPARSFRGSDCPCVPRGKCYVRLPGAATSQAWTLGGPSWPFNVPFCCRVTHIIMADVMANEALSRILVSCSACPPPSALPAVFSVSTSLSVRVCSARMPVAICGLSWLSEHACILLFMHYHVTVRHFSPSLSLSVPPFAFSCCCASSFIIIYALFICVRTSCV